MPAGRRSGLGSGSGPASLMEADLKRPAGPPNDGSFLAGSRRHRGTRRVAGTIALIAGIIGTGAMLAGLIVPSLRELRRDVAGLRERMARLEGLFEEFTRRESAPPA